MGTQDGIAEVYCHFNNAWVALGRHIKTCPYCGAALEKGKRKPEHEMRVKVPVTEKDMTPNIEHYRPSHKPHTLLDGRVVYEGVDYAFCHSSQLADVGRKIAEAFPGFTVWVTAGPYRMADVTFLADWKRKTIGLDFYSVRPGFDYMPEILRELQSQQK